MCIGIYQVVQYNVFSINLSVGYTANINMLTRNNAISNQISTEQKMKLDWYSVSRVVTTVLALFALGVTLYICYNSNRASESSWEEVQYWLKQHKLDEFQPYFKEKGRTYTLFAC